MVRVSIVVWLLVTAAARGAPTTKQVLFGGDSKTIVAMFAQAPPGGKPGEYTFARLFDARNGKVLATLPEGRHLWGSLSHVPRPGKTEVLFVRTRPVGKDGSFEESLVLWDYARGKDVRTFEGKFGYGSLAVAPDGKRTVTGHLSGEAFVWDLETGKLARALDRAKQPKPSTAHMPMSSILDDGKRALLSREGEVTLYDLTTGKGRPLPFATAAKNPGAMTGFGSTVSGDGKWVLARAVLVGGDDFPPMRVWDVEKGEKVAERSAPPGPFVEGAWTAFADGGRTLLLYGGTLRAWDVRGKKLTSQRPLQTKRPRDGSAFSADSALLASSGDEAGTLAVWETKTGKKLWQVTVEEVK